MQSEVTRLSFMDKMGDLLLGSFIALINHLVVALEFGSKLRDKSKSLWSKMTHAL